MRKPQKSKEELLSDLTDIFRKNGFHGTTLSLLTEKTGLERASLYHYFSNGKGGMAEAVLLHVLEEFSSTVLSTLQTKEPPKTRLKKMLKALKDFYQDGKNLCFITVFSVGEVSPKVAKNLKSATETWQKLLADCLTQAKIKKPKEEAWAAVASVQGSLILNQVTNNQKAFDHTLSTLARSWSL